MSQSDNVECEPDPALDAQLVELSNRTLRRLAARSAEASSAFNWWAYFSAFNTASPSRIFEVDRHVTDFLESESVNPEDLLEVGSTVLLRQGHDLANERLSAVTTHACALGDQQLQQVAKDEDEALGRMQLIRALALVERSKGAVSLSMVVKRLLISTHGAVEHEPKWLRSKASFVRLIRDLEREGCVLKLDEWIGPSALPHLKQAVLSEVFSARDTTSEIDVHCVSEFVIADATEPPNGLEEAIKKLSEQSDWSKRGYGDISFGTEALRAQAAAALVRIHGSERSMQQLVNSARLSVLTASVVLRCFDVTSESGYLHIGVGPLAKWAKRTWKLREPVSLVVNFWTIGTVLVGLCFWIVSKVRQ